MICAGWLSWVDSRKAIRPEPRKDNALDKLLISCFNKCEWLVNTNIEVRPEQNGYIVRKPEKGNEEKMMEVTSVLQLRVLLSFLKEDHETCTVTGISKTLGEEKYTVSRVVAALEKEGLIDRSDSRRPLLTAEGRRVAERYQERIHVTLNHLTFEGVDLESAKQDAYHWALYNTDQTMEVLRNAEEQYRVKYELRDRKSFGGAEISRRLKDGSYQFPFLIYREQVKDGRNLSMGNEGFEHPCTLSVHNGVGTVQIKAVEIRMRSKSGKGMLKGTVKNIKYYDGADFIGADITGNIWSFPLKSLQFVNIGNGIGQLLHGSVCLKITSTVGQIHMPESIAIFTMII